MTDSYDDEELLEGRPVLYRIVEGLSVIAFVVAVVIWQSDGTLEAVKRLASGEVAAPAGPLPLVVTARASDVRLAVAPRPAPPAEDLDTTRTGSIAPKRETRKPATPVAVPTGWVAACDSVKPDFCSASQSLARPENPALETSWTIEKGPGGLVGVWTTPTGVLVSRGMVLSMGDGKPKTVPFESCGPRSCEVRAKLAADFIGLMKGARKISTEIVLRGGKTVTFDFSKLGLDEALVKLGA